jgi:hypothetical protein
MVKNTPTRVSAFFAKHRMVILLATILTLIIGQPLLAGFFNYRFIPDVLLTFIFVAAIHAISQKRVDAFIALALAIPMFAGVWLNYWYDSPKILIASQIFGTLFVVFTISRLAKFIFNEKEVTKEVIFAAVVVYLLMAITWAFLYLILEFFRNGSIAFPFEEKLNFFDFLYFSCVTITTLGYGDVLPLTQQAKALAILEAITGQMYLVVVVAWLVGMYVTRRSR